jgi:8-oxo-dGTP pyrophosphatase MutT (NUDIX family)
MNPQRIRPLVLCVFRHSGRILVAEGYDPLKQQHFYRPLGGGIEFGEYAEQAIVREIREELDAEVANLRYLGTLENIFTFNGQRGHEIVLIYDGTFIDSSCYERGSIAITEGAPDQLGRAMWRPLEDFKTGNPPLYPDRLYELLTTQP